MLWLSEIKNWMKTIETSFLSELLEIPIIVPIPLNISEMHSILSVVYSIIIFFFLCFQFSHSILRFTEAISHPVIVSISRTMCWRLFVFFSWTQNTMVFNYFLFFCRISFRFFLFLHIIFYIRQLLFFFIFDTFVWTNRVFSLCICNNRS